MCRLLGRPRDRLLDTPLDALLESGRDTAREILATLDTAPRHVFAARADAPSRRWLRLELACSDCAGFAATLTAADVEAQKRLEAERSRLLARYEQLESLHRIEAEAHRDTEHRLQSALNAARMGTWTWDPRLDAASHDARALEILDGVSGAETLAAAIERHLSPDAVTAYRRHLAYILDPDSDEHQFDAEIPWRRRNGEWSWVHMTGEAHFEGEGADRRATLVSGTVLDITERKRNEEALAETSTQKDRFLATLAHELRNPLAPLYYAVELLRAGSEEERAWAAGVIERQVSHLTRLIDDLLDISRIGRGQLETRREPVAIEKVVRAAIEATRLVLQAHEQELVLSLPAEPIVISGDFVRLTQVLTNLLTNAAKFSRGPGKVTLTVERDNETVRLSVEDEGVGIVPDDLPRLFEMFYQGGQTLPRSRSGLGVGLYLVRNIIELHGGSVAAKSKGQGKGSIFVVRLPIDRAASDSPAARDVRVPRAAREPRRILLVDDNRDSADALAKLLQAAGDEVCTAYDGWAALDVAERFHPDVVLLDLGMPTIDGFEVCRRIRSRAWGRNARIIALTGWGRREDRERTREAGFDEHLIKPVTFADVDGLLHTPP